MLGLISVLLGSGSARITSEYAHGALLRVLRDVYTISKLYKNKECLNIYM